MPWDKDDLLRGQREANERLVLAALRLEQQAETARLALLDASAAVGFLRGSDLVIEFANPRLLTFWGRTTDVIGKPLLEAIPELRGQGFDDLIADVMRTGVPFVAGEMPAKVVRNGKLETGFFNFAYTATRDAANVIDGVSLFAFDATPQAVARQRVALAARVGRSLVSKACLRDQLRDCSEALMAFGVACVGIWTHDASHEVLELEASAGLSAHLDEAHARVAPGAGSVGRIAKSRAPFLTNDVVRDGDAADREWARREGIAAFAGYPLVVGDRLLGVMAVFAKDELSEEERTALSSVADQIALGVERDNSDRFRELFIGILGHDLRNPLNAVTMSADLLAEDPALPPARATTVQRIRVSASRMGRMIDQVLDLTRARVGGGIPIDRESADVHEICARAVDELASANPQRVIEATYSGDGHGEWDPDRLLQVFSNLIGNALTHGRKDATVRVEVNATGAAVRCSVWNLGVPIPAAFLTSLFDPFRQGHVGRTHRAGGLGLGLFIAQQIVVAHGGLIGVQSSADEGTRFSFDLPRREDAG